MRTGVVRQPEEAEQYDRLMDAAQHLDSGIDGATICRDSRGLLYLSVRTQRGVLDVVPAHEGGARPPGEVHS